ncbi:MAG: ribonuclease P protein component [Actinomycetota bacterium]
MEEGRRVSGPRLVLFWRPGTGAIATIAGRRVGGAVARNRARRILRAAWREAAPDRQEDLDMVLLARNTIVGARSPELVTEIRDLMGRAGARSV